jgi:hypothetical protein
VNWVWQESHVGLDQSEWFDIRAEVDGSNQRARDGWFRMQVRCVKAVEYFGGPVANTGSLDRLRVEGRRYKADGSLSSTVASATVRLSQLPEPAAAWINHMTDRFRESTS